MTLRPDETWTNLVGVRPSGEVVPISAEDLEAIVDTWTPLLDRVEDAGTLALLSSARALFTQSWLRYELLVDASLKALQAVECGLRQILYPILPVTTPFKSLVWRAESDGLLIPSEADLLRAGVELRNALSHPLGVRLFTPGMAADIIERGHEFVSIFARRAISD